jgi:hypothetical protein
VEAMLGKAKTFTVVESVLVQLFVLVTATEMTVLLVMVGVMLDVPAPVLHE